MKNAGQYERKFKFYDLYYAKNMTQSETSYPFKLYITNQLLLSILNIAF